MKKTIIKAGSKLSETEFDFETEGFIVPTVWELNGGKDRKITVHFSAEGYSERCLRKFDWCGVDEDAFDEESEKTMRYFKTHSIESVLSGNNPNVSVKGIRVDDCACVTADLDVKKNLGIRPELYLDYGVGVGFIDIFFVVIVWDANQPIEKYLIECLGDVVITKYRNNGKSVAKWPAEEEIKITLPR